MCMRLLKNLDHIDIKIKNFDDPMNDRQNSLMESPFRDQKELSDDIVRQHLQRVLNSPAFEATDAQKAFLKFVVEKVLSGQASEIKGYTVATQVFNRGADFDQATDPVGSIHANKPWCYGKAGFEHPNIWGC